MSWAVIADLLRIKMLGLAAVGGMPGVYALGWLHKMAQAGYKDVV